jgi:hypothetical protein
MTTTEEVIRLVRSTADKGEGYPVIGSSIVLDIGEMKRLIKLVKAEENEACAKVCDNADACGEESIMRHILESQILAIRARRNHGLHYHV